MLTSCIDTDREVLKYIPDISLPKFFGLNKRFYYQICNDNFLQRRLKKYYNISQYKKSNETWKCFYSRAIFTIHKMKKDFNFEYSQGDFQKQLQVFEKFKEICLIFQDCNFSSFFSFIKNIFKLFVLLYRSNVFHCIYEFVN